MTSNQLVWVSKFEKCLFETIKRIGLPIQQYSAGRPLKRSLEVYTLAIVTKIRRDETYRSAEETSKIPKSTLHRILSKLSQAWIELVIEITSSKLALQVQVDSQVLDSTGVSLSANGFKRKLEYDSYLKLHALTVYYAKNHCIWFTQAKVTTCYVHDIKPAYEFIPMTKFNACLLADKAYDSIKLYRLAFRQGLAVCMRQRKNCESRKGPRGEVYKQYDNDFYRNHRGRVESPFGTFAISYASRVREKLLSNQEKVILLRVAIYNLKTTVKILITLTYGTVSKHEYSLYIRKA